MPTPSEDLFNNLYNGGTSPLALAVDGRIYPVRLPQAEPSAPRARIPCVVYRRVFTDPQAQSHAGWGGLMKCRWQFDCWALTHYDAEAVADTLRAALVAAPLAAQQVSVMDADAGGDESLYRVIVEAYTWFDEEA
jgi:hypothetical protein